MADTQMAMMPLQDYKDMCDAIREKTGSTDAIKSGDLKDLISGIESGSGSSETDTSVEDGLITKTLSGEYKNSRITSVGNYGFHSCKSLTGINLSSVESVGDYSFQSCTALTNVSLPMVTTVGMYAFSTCSAIKDIELPSAVSIGKYAFSSCVKLIGVKIPLATTICDYTFNSCSKLTSVDFPVATSIGNYAFQSCSVLTSVDFPVATSIGDHAFNNCSNLMSLILRNNSTVCTYKTALYSNDPTNANLKIYVPSELVDSYKTATNWSRLADHFVALEDYTIDGTTTGEMNKDADGNIVARES